MRHLLYSFLLVIIVTASSAAQINTWHIFLKDGTSFLSAVPLRRVDDSLMLFRDRRITIPVQAIATMEQHTSGQSAGYFFAGVFAGGSVGYFVENESQYLPTAIGALAGGIAGAMLGSAHAENIHTTYFDSLSESSKYAFLDSVIASYSPFAERTDGPSSPGESEKLPDEKISSARPVQPDQLKLNLFASFSIPLGSFLGLEGYKVAGAQSGLGIGGEAIYSLDNSVACVGSLEMSFHQTHQPWFGGDYDNGLYFLMWPMGGLRVGTPLDDQTELYLQAGAGMLIQKSPSVGVKGGASIVDATTTGTFAYSIGTGFLLGGRTFLSVRYLNGGIPEFATVQIGSRVNPRTFATEITSTAVPIRQPTALLEFSAGVFF